MSDFADYLQRICALNQNAMRNDDASDLLTSEGMQRASEIAIPTWERLAERAGLELQPMFADMQQSLNSTIALVLARMVSGNDVVNEVGSLTVSIGVQMFLAGVNWEQERHLPPAPVEGETP